MKRLISVLLLFAVDSYASDSDNGKEYKMRQTLQNVSITGTGYNSINTSGGINVSGQATNAYIYGTMQKLGLIPKKK